MASSAVPHFRAGAVAVVRGSDHRVLAFARVDHPGHWQFPQGGLEAGETGLAAAWRELHEETGLGDAQVRFVAEHPKWMAHELPVEVQRDGRIGRVHRWVLFEARTMDIRPVPDGRELRDWRWWDPTALVEQIVNFKRDNYLEALGAMGLLSTRPVRFRPSRGQTDE